jgi:hypothetical protein
VVSDPDGPRDVTGRGKQTLRAAQKLIADQGLRETNLNDVATQLGPAGWRSTTISGPGRGFSTS